MFLNKINDLISKSKEERLKEKERKEIEAGSLLEKIQSIKESNQSLFTDNKDYIAEDDLGDRIHAMNHLIKHTNLKQYRQTEQYQQLKSEMEQMDNEMIQLNKTAYDHNRRWLYEHISVAREMIGMVENRPLDNQQMACVVKHPHNHLVVAGAGTGKTTTIIGKIKYLLKSETVRPEEILVLSFTNAAASEMQQRLKKETEKDIWVSTFHKLGLSIIRKVEKKTPDIFSEDLHHLINEKVLECCKDRTYAFQLISYFISSGIPEKNEFDFDSEKSYQDYLQYNPPVTIRKEKVKSYGEVQIANYLTQKGISYIYEADYKVDTSTEEYGQYHPDFYLPDYDIYIEYFGINRKNRVPSYFKPSHNKSASEAYVDSMKWKRKIHKENNTVLIECYAYENMEKTLLDNLEANLIKHNVRFHDLTLEEMQTILQENNNNIFSSISDIFSTLIMLTKNNRYEIQDLIRLCDNHKNQSQKTLVHLFEPVFEHYQSYLKEKHQIDFTDMINTAAEYADRKLIRQPFRFVIIDEYQDVSKSQIELLSALRRLHDFDLFCVGDDWQSIYQFAGSDIGYILNFRQVWGRCETDKIETTYRFPQSLIEISGKFIMKNPAQLKKELHSPKATSDFSLAECQGYNDQWAIQFMTSRLLDLPKNSTVFMIGRYKFDINLLKTCPDLDIRFNNRENKINITYLKRPDLKIDFYTAHRSKGLQADYVFIINNHDSYLGFPSKIQDCILIHWLTSGNEEFPFAEERRLFYVALTRARKKVFLVTVKGFESLFVKELKEEYAKEIRQQNYICPVCGEKLLCFKTSTGFVYRCSAYKTTGCNYKKFINKK